MAFGITSTGFLRKSPADIVQSYSDFLRARVSKFLKFSERTIFGNWVNIGGDQLGRAWEALELLANQFDPDRAEGYLLEGLCLLTGVKRNGPQKGQVTCTVNLDANLTFQPGELVAHVQGNPDNRWENAQIVTSTTAGDYETVFKSEGTGSAYVAAANTLTVKAQNVTGWNSVTNDLDADPGADLEDLEDLRARRDTSLAVAGAATNAAVAADVGAVSGVLECVCLENNTNRTIGTLPANSIRAIVWDGVSPEADNGEIAQAILDGKSAGIKARGQTFGTATDPDGEPTKVAFDRATVIQVELAITVSAPDGADTDAIKAAVIAKGPNRIGGDVIFEKLQAGVFDVDGVEDLVSFELSTDPPSVTDANVPIAIDEIAVIDSGNITVTVNP